MFIRKFVGLKLNQNLSKLFTSANGINHQSFSSSFRINQSIKINSANGGSHTLLNPKINFSKTTSFQMPNQFHLVGFSKYHQQRDSNEYIASPFLLKVQKISTGLGLGYFLLMVSTAGLLIYDQVVREREIIDHAVDLKRNDHHGMIVDSTRFTPIGKKTKGELSGEIMLDTLTGKRYLKKGAKSKDTLIKEFVAASFLAALNPGVQPEALILQERHQDGTARFYTLSRIFDNSMDLEEFIMLGNWKEKLAKKPVIGFDVAIAMDNLLAKGSDTKFANYIIIEKEDAYMVACIDHEAWDASLLFSSRFISEIGMNFLANHMVDTNDSGAENKIGLYDQPEEALEFLRVANQSMSMENVENFYKKVSKSDFQNIIQVIMDVNGSDGVMDDKQTRVYFDKLIKIRDAATMHEVTNHSKHLGHESLPQIIGMKK